jgi:Skp family chaperone for outer membrane proteins
MKGICQKTKWMIPALLLPMLLGGCLTTQQSQQRNRETVRMRENYRLLEEDNRRLEGHIESLQLEMERMQSDLFTVRSQSDDAARRVNSEMESRLGEIERQVALLQQQRISDRREIVEQLSEKIATLIKSSGASRAPAGQKRTARSEYGYEHVVQPGETLSEIAAAYGVSVGVIIRENSMKNPNVLQVGQKLFIPE